MKPPESVIRTSSMDQSPVERPGFLFVSDVVIARSASDEAIHYIREGRMDCFAALAMTKHSQGGQSKLSVVLAKARTHNHSPLLF
jgi:hypothetical protein